MVSWLPSCYYVEDAFLHPYRTTSEKVETQGNNTSIVKSVQACLEFFLNKILMEKSSIRLISPFLPGFCVSRTIAESMPCISIVNSLLASCWISYSAAAAATARCTEKPIIQWIFTRAPHSPNIYHRFHVKTM